MKQNLVKKLTTVLMAGSMLGGIAAVATGCRNNEEKKELLEKISYDTDTTISKGIHSIQLSASANNYQIIINANNDKVATGVYGSTYIIYHYDFEIIYSLEKDDFYNLFNILGTNNIESYDILSKTQCNSLYDTISNNATLISCKCVLDESAYTI